MHFSGFTAKQFDQWIGYKPQCHTIRNTESKWHPNDYQVRWQSLVPLAPIYMHQVPNHETTNYNKNRSSNGVKCSFAHNITSSNHTDEWSKKSADKNKHAVTTLANPVRPSTAIPVELSM